MGFCFSSSFSYSKQFILNERCIGVDTSAGKKENKLVNFVEESMKFGSKDIAFLSNDFLLSFIATSLARTLIWT